MTIGVDMSALGDLATSGAEELKTPGEQMEYLFAQQLLKAMQPAEGTGREGEEYLGLLSDHLAREIVRGGGLGIAKQLGAEVPS